MWRNNKILQFFNWQILGLIIVIIFLTIDSGKAEDVLCARVQIEIRQEVTLERQAFDAHMRINNGLSHITLENVDVDVSSGSIYKEST